MGQLALDPFERLRQHVDRRESPYRPPERGHYDQSSKATRAKGCECPRPIPHEDSCVWCGRALPDG